MNRLILIVLAALGWLALAALGNPAHQPDPRPAVTSSTTWTDPQPAVSGPVDRDPISTQITTQVSGPLG